MDDGAVVIARIPNPNAGPPFKTTASEVATMDFARTVLEIPVPKVLAWSAEAENPVESEYILMEEAAGTQLGEVWDKMEIGDKLKIVDDIVAIERKFTSISFTRYGSLYFASDAFPGCEKLEIVGDLPQSLRNVMKNRFVIGPVVDRDFWHRERASMDIDRGPWNRASDYLLAIGQREIAWIRKYAAHKPVSGLLAISEAQRTPESHIVLYKKFLDVVEYLLPEGEEIRPTLWHWDIHAPNIFVDKDHITGLIDWQDIWVGPLFLQARHPRLVAYNGELITKLPKSYDTLEDGDEKEHIRTQVEKSIILWTYKTETKNANPILHDLLSINQGRNRRDTVDFSANTWDRDIIPFRQCLIRIARHWNEINSEIPCPIGFTDEELEAHLRDGEGWNSTADFWDSVQGFVQRDGWTSNEDYEQALEIFAQIRDQGLESLSGKELVAFEEGTRWAVRRPEKIKNV
ncbi:kinase-like domain-containing protein [Boeremia exigua]|uniref:kinase-like domain-containing protein n=1 Tax=Boeremia exigua TaxID=749465 RepID=UPI001E8DD69C|nr:kinase-like domain-containing protein [Boeremia exigua]KAH6638995.1 kinase-like domain-containing protein [Boeremia exigua]